MLTVFQESRSSATSLCTPQPDYYSTTHEITPYDIFLSHSGKQKGFARDLYRVLCPIYRTFFDITPHSLPVGEHFPSLIFNAAITCRVAVVVLSEEFMCSKWAMLELCSFVDNHIKILPLFYQLSPEDLKLEENFKRWKKVWEGHAEHAVKNPIDISQWGDAVRSLRRLNGVIYDESKGLLEYLDKIMSGILNLLPHPGRCDDEGIFGKDRLCKVILDTFEDMERHANPSKAFVLSLFGPPGSGKTTISLFLRDHFRQYSKRVLHLKLPSSDICDEELLKVFKQLLDLTDFQDTSRLDKIYEPRDVLCLLKGYNFPNQSVCLVVDNIDSQSIKAVQKILELGVGAGSKVILVAQSPDVLEPALRMRQNRYMFESVSMPHLAETEALDLFLHHVGVGMGLDACAIESLVTPMHREIALEIVRLSSDYRQIGYLPVAVKEIAEEVLRHRKFHLQDVREDVEAFFWKSFYYITLEKDKGKDQTIVLQAQLHDEACQYKVYKAISGYPGVKDLSFNLKSQKVTLKVGRDVDPCKLFASVQKKSGAKITDLLVYTPPTKEEPVKMEETEDVTVVLKVHMHSDACIKRVKKIAWWHVGDVYSVHVEGDKITINGKSLDPKRVLEVMAHMYGKHVELVPLEKKDGLH